MNLQKDLSLVFFDLSPLVTSKTNLSSRRTRMQVPLTPGTSKTTVHISATLLHQTIQMSQREYKDGTCTTTKDSHRER